MLPPAEHRTSATTVHPRYLLGAAEAQHRQEPTAYSPAGRARPGRRRVAAVHGVNTMLAADRFTITTTLTLAITVTTTNTTTAAAVVR